MRRPLEHTKWYDLVRAVARGEDVECTRGGKEVHATDVGRAVCLLIDAPEPNRRRGLQLLRPLREPMGRRQHCPADHGH
ncbi:MAG: hypothetical protein R3C10_17365 [Pirellulales bacterium]